MSMKSESYPSDCDPAVPAGKREERRTAILDAAESLFCERGFEAVTLADIVKRAGGSLATVYMLFENKQGLLRAMLDRADHRGLDDLTAVIEGPLAPVEKLRNVAYRLHDYLTQDRSVAIMRTVIAESLRDPSFARSFHCDVHEARIAELAALFRDWNAAGLAEIDDPDAAAELYFAMVTCEAQVGAMFGIGCPPGGAEAERRIDWRLAPFFSHFRIGS